MDPLIGAALISGGMQLVGDITGGLMGKAGQEEANELNYQMFKENQDWQENFYQHRHRWEVADLKAAGLNPVLSANSAGSVPGGSYQPMQNVNEALSRGIGNSGKALSDLTLQIGKGMLDKGKAEAEGAKVDTAVKRATMDAQIAKEKALATSFAVSSARDISRAKFNDSRFGKWSIGVNQAMRNLLGRDNN